MESLFKIPPPTFRRYQKSRRYSVRLPEPDSDLLIALARDRREPPATTLIILVQAALAALPKPAARLDDSEANKRAAQKVREQAEVERERAEDCLNTLGKITGEPLANAYSSFATRLDELAAYIEAGDSSRE